MDLIDSMKDLIIIGSGPGGYVAAILAAKKGLDVGVVEKEQMGGICTNHGCIPSKALLSVAEKIDSIEGAKRDGIEASIDSIDFDKVMAKKERAVKISRKAVQGLFDEHDIDIVEGTAEISGPEELKVKRKDGEVIPISTENIIIATGSEPSELPDIKFDGDRIVSSKGALSFDEIPDSMVIIGGGYIGLEMAYIYSSLGTDVTIVEIMKRLLPQMDKDLSDVAEDLMKRKDVDVLTESKVENINKQQPMIVDIEGKKDREIIADKVLTAVGRSPNPPSMELSKDLIGERGEIVVDGSMRTKIDGIYAVGDVTGESMLAHSAYKQAEIAIKDVVGEDPKEFTDYNIPAGIYTHPEMASVGLTEEEAKDLYDEVKIGKYPISRTGRGSSTGERMGIAKIIADSENRLIGIHLACPGATDLIMEGTAALHNEMDAEDFAEMIHPHPTYSEALKEAAENVFSNSIHS